MSPCASCRWTGSAEPGGYSTMIISISLPGYSGKGFVMSGVTTASTACAGAARELQAMTTDGRRFFSIDMAESSAVGTGHEVYKQRQFTSATVAASGLTFMWAIVR